MSLSYIDFDLQDGFIGNWLAAGPQAVPVGDLSILREPDFKKQIAQRNYEKKSGIFKAPVERGPLTEGTFRLGNYVGEWNYYRCREDHQVDLSTSSSSCDFVRSWAYTQLVSGEAQTADFVLSTFGPADVWVNKKNVCHVEDFSGLPSAHYTFQASLKEGSNEFLVRFAGVANPDAVLAIAVLVQTPGISVRIPTLIPSISRRNELEGINEMLYLDRDIYAGSVKIELHWPEEVEKYLAEDEKSTHHDVRFQTASGSIYALAEDIGKPGHISYLGTPVSLKEGPYNALILPRAWELYESHIRVTREINTWVMGPNRFSSSPYGTLEERTQEALVNAARRENNIFAEIAKMVLDAWLDVEEKVVNQAIDQISQQQYDSEIPMLGLLGALTRFGKKAKFPAWIKEKLQPAVLNYHYTAEEAGVDPNRFQVESRQIVFATCAVLAGQMFPDETFTGSGLTGRKLKKKAEGLALNWMQTRGASGFADWDTKAGYAESLMALSHLVDLAKSEPVWELGSVLMDKIFFSIALNAYQGVLGGPQRRASAQTLKSGYVEETSGITRLMWGMGVFNSHTAGTVSLACMNKYELPPILADIAAGLRSPAELWNREQHAMGENMVNKVTYRTPDGILSSAQDYRPGEWGEREHIWQATFGPQNVVFVTHPGNSSEKDVHAPNFWLGNAVLPRVAQWKDTLVALYNLPENDRMGFTHAYFPTVEFDEFILRGSTAFARQGSGYIALTASQGLEMVSQGRTAFRELRSYGQKGRLAMPGRSGGIRWRFYRFPGKGSGFSNDL